MEDTVQKVLIKEEGIGIVEWMIADDISEALAIMPPKERETILQMLTLELQAHLLTVTGALRSPRPMDAMVAINSAGLEVSEKLYRKMMN